MNIICIDGYQYLDLGNDEFALIMDEDGNPVKEDKTVKRWVKTGEKEFTLVHGVRETCH